MMEEKETECTGCEYLGTDGCGPGTVMLCDHPIFNGIHDYANAIVQWRHYNPRIVVSDVCPKDNPHFKYKSPNTI